MILYIQYPLLDLRSLIDDKDPQKYFFPTSWLQNNKYVKSFGESCERDEKSGLFGTQREFVHARRAMRFRDLDQVRINPADGFKVRPQIKSRTFFTDGTISHYDICLSFKEVTSNTKSLHPDLLARFLGGIFQIPVYIPTGEAARPDGKPEYIRKFKKAKLLTAGRQMASLYYGATLTDINKLSSAKHQQLVIDGTPLVILHYCEEDLEFIPDTFTRIECENEISLSYTCLQINSWNYDVWLIKDDESKGDAIRRLINCLSKLHHEKDGLMRVIKWLDLNHGHVLFKRNLMRFLNKNISRLARLLDFGYDKQKLIAAIYKGNLSLTSEQLNRVLEEINIQIEMDLINKLFEGGITVNNNSVSVGGDNYGQIVTGKISGDVINEFSIGMGKTIDCANDRIKADLENLKQKVLELAQGFVGTDDEIKKVQKMLKQIEVFSDEAASEEPDKTLCQSIVETVGKVAEAVTAVTTLGIPKIVEGIMGKLFEALKKDTPRKADKQPTIDIPPIV
ncbi:MAG: hypothetical protein FWG91_10950 [Lachnospiraceae bacterium]|nr:hypothetical protein [Lachnospiraceae bacterium]